MNRRAKWICAPIDTKQAGIAFLRSFKAKKEIKMSLKLKESRLPKTWENSSVLCYYNSTDISTASITGESVNGAYFVRSLGVKTLKKMTKYQVDIMGNITPAPFEPRKAFVLKKGR